MTTNPPSPFDPPPWIGGGPPRRHCHSIWAALGMALAVVLGVLGLMIVACGVIFVIGLNSWGNNK
jgi:hypothetical protein